MIPLNNYLMPWLIPCTALGNVALPLASVAFAAVHSRV